MKRSEEIELLQGIGDEVCEGCGSPTMVDCGEDPNKCSRIVTAIDLLRDAMDREG